MVRTNYDWSGGVTLEDHTKKKHDILRKYFRQYLITRCQLPKQEKFRLSIVDGFAGAGIYAGGEFGSPLIFVDVLIKTINEINLRRIGQNIRPIQIECLLIMNDLDESTIVQLRKNITPLLTTARNSEHKLYIEAEFLNGSFDAIYPRVKQRLQSGKCSNVLFNLDQCGYSHVTSNTVRDIITSWRSAEVLMTFMIEPLLAYLSPKKIDSSVSLEPDIRNRIAALLDSGGDHLGKKQWLGEAEKIVFTHLKDCAPFVSPFSINNPNGWRYWLMHFAGSYRARQVYNDVLHQDGMAQAHFGRSGLNMLSYDPKNEGQLYLFDSDSRMSAKKELFEDIPRLIARAGDSVGMEDFYKAAYCETPAHSDDIHEMIIENPDVEVITEAGGARRKPNSIKIGDTLRLKNQKSMIFMFAK